MPSKIKIPSRHSSHSGIEKKTQNFSSSRQRSSLLLNIKGEQHRLLQMKRESPGEITQSSKLFINYSSTVYINNAVEWHEISDINIKYQEHFSHQPDFKQVLVEHLRGETYCAYSSTEHEHSNIKNLVEKEEKEMAMAVCIKV